MKRLNIAAIAALISSPAVAESNIYAGLDFQANKANYSDETANIAGESFNIKYKDYYEDEYFGISPFIGFNITKHDSVELSYFADSEEKSNSNTGYIFVADSVPVVARTQIDLKSITLDYMRNYNLGENTTLSPILGVSRIEADQITHLDGNGVTRYTTSQSESGWGVGIGAQAKYAVTEKAFIRARAKYTSVSGVGVLDSIVSYSIGAGYNF
jgi:hypothetical protein